MNDWEELARLIEAHLVSIEEGLQSARYPGHLEISNMCDFFNIAFGHFKVLANGTKGEMRHSDHAEFLGLRRTLDQLLCLEEPYGWEHLYERARRHSARLRGRVRFYLEAFRQAENSDHQVGEDERPLAKGDSERQQTIGVVLHEYKKQLVVAASWIPEAVREKAWEPSTADLEHKLLVALSEAGKDRDVRKKIEEGFYWQLNLAIVHSYWVYVCETIATPFAKVMGIWRGGN